MSKTIDQNDPDLDNLDDSLEEWDKDEQQKFGDKIPLGNPLNMDSEDDSSSSSEEEKEQEEKKTTKQLKQEQYESLKDYGYGDHLIKNEDVEEKPPLIVVVQGPKKSGKTTLIKSLVKHYTKHKLQSVEGNITVRAGKKQRITFIECPSEINAMIDLAKIADLALILIDASLGFELETFEFLSLLRSHGFPNVMGVLTHMDYFKENKQQRKSRKRYKKRFEHEVGHGNKLFYFPGVSNGLYPKRDVQNLARFLSVINYAKVAWKENHPFIVPDRWENSDATSQVIPNEQLVSVQFYGYVRGCSYRTNSRVSLIGLGDYDIDKVEVINDPCPAAEKEDKSLLKQVSEDEDESDSDDGKDNKEKQDAPITDREKKKQKHRSLKAKETVIYAPYSNLGFLNYEQTGGYITIPDKYVYYTRKEKVEKYDNEGNLIEEKDEQDIDEEQEEDPNSKLSGVKLMRDLQDLKQGIDENDEGDTFLLDGVKLDNGEKNQSKQQQEEQQKQSQEQITDKAQLAFNQKQREIMNLKHKTQNIQKLSHVQAISDQMLATDLSEIIYGNNDPVSKFDCSKFYQKDLLSKEMYKLAIKKQFMAGSGYGMDEELSDEDSDAKETKKQKFLREEKEEEEKKKLANSTQVQELDTFMDSYLGIYKKGTYVKMTIKIQYKHFKQFNPKTPLILARINPGEDTFGFIKATFKKHRWYGNLLKSKDPLIFSIGWRRFQSIPVYCTEDQDIRTRYLKYTPQHDYCTAIFYGNFAPQNTGFICTQSLNDKLAKFRIAATGQVIQLNHTFDVMKKLKLIGEPFKIYKNSAFVKGMFNSSMEVSKFEGAMVKTVSGIRGQIKKSIKEGGEGSFRATFEDKIIKSDLIFLRSWFKMPLQKFYNPIISYDKMRLMKTTWELRKQQGIELKQNKDSEYKEIERPERNFKESKISNNLKEALPFQSKEKITKLSLKEKLAKKEESIPIKSLTSDTEKQTYALIQRLNTIRKEKVKLQKSKKEEKSKIKTAQKQGMLKKYEVQRKEYVKQQTKQKFVADARKKKKQEGE